jgi:hypothetical protein
MDNCAEKRDWFESFEILNEADQKMKIINAILNETSEERYQVLNDEVGAIIMNEMMYYEYYRKKLIYWNLQTMEDEDHQESEIWFRHENF